ncbi:MAG: DnaB-like helicase C-terminal domain-containing protein [Bacteroidota bacterium]
MAKRYNPAEQYTDPGTERAVLTAIYANPSNYFRVKGRLLPDHFVTYRSAWITAEDAITKETTLTPAVDFIPLPSSVSIEEHAGNLRDLLTKRQAVYVADDINTALTSGKAGAVILRETADRLRLIQTDLREIDRSSGITGNEVLRLAIASMEVRRAKYEATGKPVMGLPTGISAIDDKLNGLEAGLHLLGAGPSTGKTTLATQIAIHVARSGSPAVYVTFENSAENLIIRVACQLAELDFQDVRRGLVDPAPLGVVAREYGEIFGRITMIDGSGRLTVPDIRATALQAMTQHRAESVLIVVDYLQLMAKASAELRNMATGREKVEALAADLREMGMAINAPILALSSLNRADGAYGESGKTPPVSSLKESGDLEFAADTIIMLSTSSTRIPVEPLRAIDATLKKNRLGPLGSVDLIFDPTRGRFAQEETRYTVLAKSSEMGRGTPSVRVESEAAFEDDIF